MPQLLSLAPRLQCLTQVAWCRMSALMVVLVASCLCPCDVVEAQRPPAAGKKGGAPAGTKPAAPGNPKTAPASDANTPAVPPLELPADYTPPKAEPDALTQFNELIGPADIQQWGKIKNKYSSALRNGAPTAADKALITEGLKYRLYIMTMKDQVRQLSERRMELVATDLQQAGRIMKADEVKAFRRSVLEQLVTLATPLLKNNYHVRYHIATLLGELDLLPDDTVKGFKHETYPQAAEPLVSVLADPEQPSAVKIAAARSLIRIVRFGDVPVDLRHKIATAAVNELAKADTYPWYQMRLCELLSTVDVSIDLQTRQPFVVNMLRSVVRDSKRDFRTRAEAARALGRVPLDGQVDISAMMRDISQFALELATAAQQSPKDPKWKLCFFTLYGAYKPADASDTDATKKALGGLMNNTQAATIAQQSYKLIVPMVNAVLNDQAVSVPDVQALQAWLQQNAPATGGTGNVGGTVTPAQPASQATVKSPR